MSRNSDTVKIFWQWFSVCAGDTLMSLWGERDWHFIMLLEHWTLPVKLTSLGKCSKVPGTQGEVYLRGY